MKIELHYKMLHAFTEQAAELGFKWDLIRTNEKEKMLIVEIGDAHDVSLYYKLGVWHCAQLTRSELTQTDIKKPEQQPGRNG